MHTSLETIFDLLSAIVDKGDRLVTAEIFEKGQRMKLPLAAFDGGLFSGPMQQLEREWCHVLQVPL